MYVVGFNSEKKLINHYNKEHTADWAALRQEARSMGSMREAAYGAEVMFCFYKNMYRVSLHRPARLRCTYVDPVSTTSCICVYFL